MGQPIAFIQSPPNGAGSRESIRRATEKHADAIAAALEVSQLLHDRGVLDLLRGILGAGDQLIEQLSAALDSPQAIRSIRNFILLTKFFGSIPPNVLDSLVEAAMSGHKRKGPSGARLPAATAQVRQGEQPACFRGYA